MGLISITWREISAAWLRGIMHPFKVLAQTLGTGPQGAPYCSTLHGPWVLMVDSSCWHSTACSVLWPQLSQQLHHLYFPLLVPEAQLLQRLQNPPDPSVRSQRCCLCLERMICSFWLLLLSLNVTFTLPPRPSNIRWQLSVVIILYSNLFSVSFHSTFVLDFAYLDAIQSNPCLLKTRMLVARELGKCLGLLT